MPPFLPQPRLLCLTISFFIFFSHTHFRALSSTPPSELRALMDLKASLDPDNAFLSTWVLNADPCSSEGGSSFEGVGCSAAGRVANISLQGKGMTGKLSPAIAGLEQLTGLYLHYNSLYGEIPREIGNLSLLTDLYLNMNNLSGEIPSEFGNLQSLQVLQLSYNQLTGSIPTQLGSLKKISVFSIQSNQITGAIPASLGDLSSIMRLDLSFNSLFGSIPTKLADLPLLEVLDIQNNTLSGNVPSSLKRLNDGFLYEHNLDLCGADYLSLRECNASYSISSSKPQPYASGTAGPLTNKPETADVNFPCNQIECARHSSYFIVVVVATIALSAVGAFSYTQYRRRKQKLGMSFDHSVGRLSTDQCGGPGYRKNGSPLASLEYSNGWDPLADGRAAGSTFPQELIQNYRFNLEEVESATQYFSEVNVLGKSNYSTTYKGILRDGSLVAVKCINKTSCKADESEFLKGLNILTSLRHENLVRLRGFCCSRGRGECFLIYDFVPNGSLLKYLDLTDGDNNILEWSTRVSIVKGIAKGLAYLHGSRGGKLALLHQNISADKVLIDQRYSPLLSGCSFHRLLTNDTIFASLKEAAAMGYLAPEYASTGRFSEKSDIYSYGILLFQILSGKRKVTISTRLAAEGNHVQELVDRNLHGRFFEYEAAKIALLCTHESPVERPSMDAIIHELGNCSSCL